MIIKTIKISWHCFFDPICLYLIFNHYAPINYPYLSCILPKVYVMLFRAVHIFDHKTFHFILFLYCAIDIQLHNYFIQLRAISLSKIHILFLQIMIDICREYLNTFKFHQSQGTDIDNKIDNRLN
ncbi:hypothetical protein ACJX0J_035624 [Zea mays]